MRRRPARSHESATPFPEEIRKHYPACIATSDRHVMVKGRDGRIRRFPIDEGAPAATAPGSRHTPTKGLISQGLVRQLDAIYDAHLAAVHEMEAEFVYDESTRSISFHAKEGAVPLLSNKVTAFAFPDGRLHAVQSEMPDCTPACELALKGHGLSREAMQREVENYSPTRERLEVPEICESLRASGREVVHLNGDKLTTGDSIAKLKAGLEENRGPCMLLMNGHARMLDAIRTENGVHVMSIRDPFTGSVLSVRDHEGFWAQADAITNPKVPSNGTAPIRDWDAIFLKPLE